MPAKRPAPRLALIDEQRMTEAQRTLLDALRSRAPRGIYHSARAFCRVDARSRVRSRSAGAWRPLPLQHLTHASLIRIRHSMHRPAMACAV